MIISLMYEFQHVTSEIDAWIYIVLSVMLGIAICLLCTIFFEDKNDTHKQGQIDAIRGIIKWELKRNEEGEEVWTEIKKGEK